MTDDGGVGHRDDEGGGTRPDPAGHGDGTDHGQDCAHGHGRDHGHGHDHGYGPRGGSSSRTLALVAGINLVGFVGEFVGGLLFGSVALVSDAVHMLFDALAYLTAFVAAYVAERYAGSDRWTYGMHRLEPLAAFLNGVLLIPMVGFILWESYRRVLAPVEIATVPTLAVAFGGLAINAGSVYVLHGDEMSLNERGAFYHLVGDAGGSIAVVVSVLAVELTGISVIDPIAAVLIGGVVLWSAGRVLRGSGAIFFLKTPVDPEALRTDVEAIEGVSRVTDWHAWQICSQLTVATVHVETAVESMREAEAVIADIHRVLAEHGVDHATVELCPADGDRGVHLDAHAH